MKSYRKKLKMYGATGLEHGWFTGGGGGGERLGGSAYFVNCKERILYFSVLQNGFSYFVFLADHVFFRYSMIYFAFQCRLQRIFGSFLPCADSKMTA